MSELYKADASKFTREQLLELINHQTELHIEGNVMLIIAKGKIKELEHKLALAIEALESISVMEEVEEYPATRISKASTRARLVMEKIR